MKMNEKQMRIKGEKILKNLQEGKTEICHICGKMGRYSEIKLECCRNCRGKHLKNGIKKDAKRYLKGDY